MAQLAILGHATRGKEVIEILEMLSGKNRSHCDATFKELIYTIGSELELDVLNIPSPSIKNDYIIFTLEEFLEKFPYKVGDKVQHKGATSCGSIYVIEQMKWEDNQVKYIICDLYWKNCKCTVMSKDLQPYKEETMEENIIKIDIPKGYEFAGVDDDNQQVVFEKIDCQYPKTYEECCNMIGCDSKMVLGTMPVRYNTLVKLEKLLICRDAYWKIAGEQMGLGKPWEPDWDDENEFKYGLYHFRNGIMYDGSCINSTLLAFPTAEMRDAFYENFKDLINATKELL